MKTIIIIIIVIAGLIWIGELTITFKPFSISMPGWYKAAGVFLYWLAMAVYSVGEYSKGYNDGFNKGENLCIDIITNKVKNNEEETSKKYE